MKGLIIGSICVVFLSLVGGFVWHSTEPIRKTGELEKRLTHEKRSVNDYYFQGREPTENEKALGEAAFVKFGKTKDQRERKNLAYEILIGKTVIGKSREEIAKNMGEFSVESCYILAEYGDSQWDLCIEFEDDIAVDAFVTINY